MFILISALAAVIPMSTYLLLIWWFDRFDREPFKLLLVNYLWGAIGAILFALVGSQIFVIILGQFVASEESLSFLGTVATAPIVEEITKGAFLLITVRSIKFDNLTDGIVYGGAIGLGFGMTENFLYFILYGTNLANWIVIVIIRTLFSAVMHCVSTATFGAFLGYSKFKGRKHRIILPITGMILAILVHFSWNFSVSFESSAIIGFIFMIVAIVVFIIIFSSSVKAEQKMIFSELSTEIESGVIPKAHLQILSSTKRNKSGWVKESIRRSYIKAATILAFRKMQLKYSTGRSKEYRLAEIEGYRQFLKGLLVSSESKG